MYLYIAWINIHYASILNFFNLMLQLLFLLLDYIYYITINTLDFSFYFYFKCTHFYNHVLSSDMSYQILISGINFAQL